MSPAFDGISRVRLLALLVVGANGLGALTMRMLIGSLRATGGSLYGEMLALALALAIAASVGAVMLSATFASCFYSFYRRRRRDPLVGEEFLPAWADLGLVALLFITAAMVILVGFG